MEKGCILPDSELQKLKAEGNQVLPSLARFCNCTEKEVLAVLEMRNTPIGIGKDRSEELVFGYKQRTQKVGEKKRFLQKPAPELRKIQETIKERFAVIPISLSATGGKHGDSAEKNAELHRKNLYLITLDIKDAYPSINTSRVFKYIEGSLSKAVSIRFPLLKNADERKLFIRAVTHFCVSQNQLPQGAVTSMQIENMVMQGIDAAIEKKLPEFSVSGAKYSRYADDMAISFESFSTLPILKEKMIGYLKEMKPNNNPDHVDELIQEISQATFVLTDPYERKIFDEYITKFKAAIEAHPQISKEKKHRYIGQINTLKRNITRSGRRISDIKDDLIDCIGDQGRKVNTKKTKYRTPQSNSDREINGLVFNEKGERILSAKTMGQYMRMLRDLTDMDINKILNNPHYKAKFKAGNMGRNELTNKIINTLHGIYKRVEQVYSKDKFHDDTIPNKFKEAYKECMQKWKAYDQRKTQHKGANDDIPF